MVTIAARMLTIGGHQIETITPANSPNARTALQNRGSGISADITSGWSAPVGDARRRWCERSCLGNVAALAQGDGGEQRGACEKRG
jgi:hypothetical protein